MSNDLIQWTHWSDKESQLNISIARKEIKIKCLFEYFIDMVWSRQCGSGFKSDAEI